jgi:SGNH hydrolase-like domain, acetyltransferase AlgX
VPRRLRLLPIAWLLALLVLPAAGWFLGARQPLLDNRPKTPVPHLGVEALRHGSTYQQFDAALLERLPPRGRALEAHTRIGIDVFHDSPNPDVLIGSGGRYYYRHALQTCIDAPPPDDAAQAAEIVARTLVAAGKRALVMEPAAKALMESQAAGAFDPKVRDCAVALQERVARRLAQTPGGFDIDAPLRRMQRAGEETFLPRDTHWNWRGRLLYVRTVLDFLRPGLADAVGLQAGAAFQRPGDLSALVALKDRDADREIVARRTPNPPLTPGGAVIIGDSQTARAFVDPPGPPGSRPLRDTVLAGVPICSVEILYAGGCNDAITAASRVVYESVGRNLRQFSMTCWGIVQLVGGTLTGPAGSFQRVDGVAPVAPRTVTVGTTGTARLRVVPAGADVAPRARLLKFAVRHLAAGQHASMDQAPQAGPPGPCSSPVQPADGGPLILSVPAGRRASDLIVTITAPPGTVLDAPHEIALDGRPARKERRRQDG